MLRKPRPAGAVSKHGERWGAAKRAKPVRSFETAPDQVRGFLRMRNRGAAKRLSAGLSA
jgi:hypothetical protein